MLATTSLLLYGIPFIYQGQEIGMTNCRKNDISEYDDINTLESVPGSTYRPDVLKSRRWSAVMKTGRDNAPHPHAVE